MSDEKCGKPTKTGAPCQRPKGCPTHPDPPLMILQDALEAQKLWPGKDSDFWVALAVDKAVKDVFYLMRETLAKRRIAGQPVGDLPEITRRLNFGDLYSQKP